MTSCNMTLFTSCFPQLVPMIFYFLIIGVVNDVKFVDLIAPTTNFEITTKYMLFSEE